MKSNEFDSLPLQGLVARVQELKQEYFALRAAVLSGKEKNSASLRQLKRRVARAQTRLSYVRQQANIVS